MAKWRSSGGLEGTPSFGKGKQEGIKAFFDKNIIQQYVDDFQTQFGIPRDRLWTNVADVLVAGESTRWRWIKQVGRHGMQEQAEPEPRIKEMLRYIAATDREISVPCGRDIVLRSLAATLTHIRAQLPGYAGQEINAREVELLRFALEHPGYIDRERGITETMIEKMRGDINHALGIASSYSLVEEVRGIIKAWRPCWVLLIESIPYQWIYYKHAKLQ